MKNLASLLFLVLAVSSCSTVSQATYEGATVGALAGGTAGALLDKKNAWRGAVIGGTIGAFLGASLTEVAVRASREAHARQRPVYYESSDGRQIYAEPVRTEKGCTIVRTSYYRNGRLEKVEEVKVCG